jgi:FHS family Na+ dependent glucose MFS transporter 1
LHFFFGVGSFTAPLILGQVLLRIGDIHWMYYSFALVSIPILIWLWLMPEPPRATHTDEQSTVSFAVMPVVLVLILFLLYVGLELGFGNWIYTYAVPLGLANEVTAAYINATFWLSFTFGRLLGVWISTRMRPLTIIIADLIGCAISAIIIMLWRDSSNALWIGTIGLGISMASIFPTIILLAGERMRITGAITGWFLVGSGAGSLLIPWLIGQIFVVTGPEAMTTVLLVAILLTFVVLFLFSTQKKEVIPDLA